jgi:hypothetical protein
LIILAALAWLAGFAFVAMTAVRGLRGGPVRLPFRGEGAGLGVSGRSARVVGWIFTGLALFLLALPVSIVISLLSWR